MIYISFVDIDTFEISNISILILIILNIIFYISQNGFNVFYRIFVNGIISALIIFLIFFISKEKAMGFGDVLLSFSLGLNFNIPKAILFNFLAFVIGGLISIIIVLLINKKKLKSQIPFGPMISIAAYLTFLYGDAIINWYLGLITY
ncbi:prepilin peptidase [Caldicellulosiruptoraceae bacterium PP1]